jgi:hypothetical protein
MYLKIVSLQIWGRVLLKVVLSLVCPTCNAVSSRWWCHRKFSGVVVVVPTLLSQLSNLFRQAHNMCHTITVLTVPTDSPIPQDLGSVQTFKRRMTPCRYFVPFAFLSVGGHTLGVCVSSLRQLDNPARARPRVPSTIGSSITVHYNPSQLPRLPSCNQINRPTSTFCYRCQFRH